MNIKYLILSLIYCSIDDQGCGISADEKLRNELFSKDRIPLWLAGSVYVGLAAISTIIFQLKWYLILMVYACGWSAFCNSYRAGLRARIIISPAAG